MSPPVPLVTIRETIERQLKGNPEELFSSFEDTPLGSASIGQVHAATLKDGREVVGKVRKPGVDRLVSVDLEIVAALMWQKDGTQAVA
jgi:ubiquinone biosynthesis protein